MKVNAFRIVAFLIVAAAFCGCDGRGSIRQPGLYVAEKSVAMADLGPRDVILRVNGIDLTKAEFECRRRIIEKVYKIKHGLGAEDMTKELRQHLSASEVSIPHKMLAAELMRQGAMKAGVVASRADVRKAYADFGRVIGKGKWDEASILKRFGVADGGFLAQMITNEAVTAAFRRQSSTNDLESVSAEELTRYQKKIEKFNQKAERENAKSRARAMKVREEILSGAISFPEAAAKKAQVSPEHGKEWGTFRLSEFDEGSEIRKWLSAAKSGDISYPIDLDDGLSLIGVVSVTPAELPPELPKEDDYALVKCTFYAFQHAEAMTSEEAREYLLKEKIEVAHRELGQRLYNEAVIEMPNGDNLFPEKRRTKQRRGKK